MTRLLNQIRAQFDLLAERVANRDKTIKTLQNKNGRLRYQNRQLHKQIANLISKQSRD